MELSDILARPHEWILSLTEEHWGQIPEVLLSSLERELGIPLEETGAILPRSDEVQPGLTLSFLSTPFGPDSLELRIEGIVGLQSDPEKTTVSASIFLFANGVRVYASSRAWYEMELGLTGDGGVEWGRQGWQNDVYGEFASVAVMGQLSRQDKQSD